MQQYFRSQFKQKIIVSHALVDFVFWDQSALVCKQSADSLDIYPVGHAGVGRIRLLA